MAFSSLTRDRVLVPLVLAAIASSCSNAPAAPGAYVALGDSYSSGVGAGRYSGGICQRSRLSYVHRLGRPVTSFRACAGASTGDVRRSQLSAFPAETKLVTISIGGNDAGFVDVIAACLLGTPARCDARVAKAERFVRERLPTRLDHVYDAIRERAPDAQVLVVGYPRLFARRPWCSLIGDVTGTEQRRLNEASDLLARTTAASVGGRDGFRFVDVRAAFDDGGVCAARPLINGVASPVSDSFHPNVAGCRTYAGAIKPLS